MYLNQKKYTPAPMIFSKQKGLGLPVALFIIIIMSIIAVAVNRINESSSQSYGQNILSLRAFYAAESGAQLRAKDALSVLPCTCGSSSDLVYDFSVKGLNLCRAATNCTSFSVNGNTYCTIESIGICENSNAQRTIEVRLK